MPQVNRPPRGFDNTTNSTRVYNNTIYIGFVKRNDDAQRMGRLSVWIPEICGDPLKETSWIICNYLSPFGGSTSIDDTKKGNQTMSGSQSSYGMWMVPPDLDNQVAVFFANGDGARAYWFGCALQQNMNHMLPGVAANLATDPSYKKNGTVPPVVEYNKADAGQNLNNPLRPPFTPMANGLATQGLAKDYERGPSSSSARREAPSKVFGFNTPRSNAVYVDDNPDNEHIRLRTRSGAQIVINETTGYVYINSKTGNSWVEISDAGIDVYTNNCISMRAMADFNVRAEGNIILDSGSSIYMQAAQDVIVQAGKTIQLGSGTDLIFTAVGGQLDVKTSTDILIEAGAGLQLEADAGPLTLKASGGLNIEAGGAMTAKSSGSMNLQSSGDITEKSGGTILRSASSIKDNSGAVADTADTPSISPMTVKGPAPTTKMDVLNGKSATTDSITSRMPSHEPWVGHPKSNLPPAPSGPATLAQIAARQGGGSSPVTSEPVTDTTQTGTGPITTTNPNESQCATGVGTLKASNSQWATINAAASAKGIPPGNMMAMADVESQFKNGATSGTGARGLFQIVGGTWNGLVNQYGAANNVSLSDSPYDDNANAKMAAEYYNENQRLLVSKGITNPSVGEIYMTHLLGGSGGSKFIQAANTNPNMPISEAISSGALSSSGVNNNPVWFGGCATVGDAYNKINGTVNAKASQYGAQAGQPAPCDRTGASGTGTATSAAGASATSAPSPSASTASAPDNTTDSGTLTGGV